MGTIVNVLNKIGELFCQHGLTMLVQFGLLTSLLLLADMAIRKRVKATLRYCLWCLLLVKLVLPTTLSLPTGIGQLAGVNFLVNLTQTKQAEPQIQTAYMPIAVTPVQTASEVTRPIIAPQDIAESSVPKAIDASVSVKTSPLDWRGVIFIVWIAGVVLLLAGFLRRITSIQKLIAQSEPAPKRLTDMVRMCREKMGVRGEVELRLSDNMASPAVCGLLRHVILVPTGLLEKMDRSKLAMVLMHELSHVKRADLWVNLFQTILQIFYFYNPFVWAANAYIRRVREQAVDEMVLTCLNGEVESYSNTLIDVAEKAFSQPRFSMATVSIIESQSKLKERIKIMLSKPIPKNTKIGFAGLLLLIVVAAVMLPMAQAVPPPEFVIKGTVSDAQTGKPIAGAKVGDAERYADEKYGAVTDSNGNYSYKTWYEEHDVKCEAAGYKIEKKTLLTKVLGLEQEKILDFALGSKKNGEDRFKVTLLNDMTIELVAICDYPEGKPRCWRPDGSKLEKQIYIKREGGYQEGKYGYIIKYDMPIDSSFELQRMGRWYHSCTVMDSGVEKKGISPDITWENNKPRRKGYQASITNEYDEGEITNLRVRVATGQWNTAAVNDGRGTDMKSDSGFVFSKAYEADGNVNIAVSGKWQEDQQQQIVAIDNNGGSYAVSTYPGIPGRFNNMKLSQIKEFRVQTRPYQWVEFRNVSLRPGVKTDAQVAVEEPTQQVDNAEKTGAKPAIAPPTDIRENTDVNIVGTIEGARFGIIKSKYGSSLCGNKLRYIPKLYLGRLICGDKIELLDANVIEGEFGLPVIKVRTFEQTSTTPANSIGWVSLTDTNFVDSFVADAGWLSKPKKRLDPEKLNEIEAFRKAYEERTQKSDSLRSYKVNRDIDEKIDVNIIGIIEGMRFGTVKEKNGSSLQGNKSRYIPKLYLGRLKAGDKIELADANVIEGEFGLPVIKVRTFEQTSTTPANSIGWVRLTDTNFVDSFVADATWLSKPKKLMDPEKMKEIEELDRAYEKTRVINEQNIATHQ